MYSKIRRSFVLGLSLLLVLSICSPLAALPAAEESAPQGWFENFTAFVHGLFGASTTSEASGTASAQPGDGENHAENGPTMDPDG